MDGRVNVQVMSVKDRKEILHAVCAGANQSLEKRPLAIAIPVEDESGNVVPFAGTASLMKGKEAAISLARLVSLIRPAYKPDIRVGNVGGNTCVILVSGSGENRPYSCPSDPDDAESLMVVYTLSDDDLPAPEPEKEPEEENPLDIALESGEETPEEPAEEPAAEPEPEEEPVPEETPAEEPAAEPETVPEEEPEEVFTEPVDAADEELTKAPAEEIAEEPAQEPEEAHEPEVTPEPVEEPAAEELEPEEEPVPEEKPAEEETPEEEPVNEPVPEEHEEEPEEVIEPTVEETPKEEPVIETEPAEEPEEEPAVEETPEEEPVIVTEPEEEPAEEPETEPEIVEEPAEEPEQEPVPEETPKRNMTEMFFSIDDDEEEEVSEPEPVKEIEAVPEEEPVTITEPEEEPEVTPEPVEEPVEEEPEQPVIPDAIPLTEDEPETPEFEEVPEEDPTDVLKLLDGAEELEPGEKLHIEETPAETIKVDFTLDQDLSETEEIAEDPRVANPSKDEIERMIRELTLPEEPEEEIEWPAEPEIDEEPAEEPEPEPLNEPEEEPEVVAGSEEPAAEPETKPEEEPLPETNAEVHLCLADRSAKEYTRVKHFAGDAEEQIEAAMTYLTNYVLETRVPHGSREEIPNYKAETLRKMIEKAMEHGDAELEVGSKGISVSFKTVDPSICPEWRVSVLEEGTKYILPVHPAYRVKPENNNPAAQGTRRSSDETKRLILKVLEKEPCSTNTLAKRLGYKGISKTLSGIVKEMIDDGEIEYTNPNSRGSNQKLRKKGYRETYGQDIM